MGKLNIRRYQPKDLEAVKKLHALALKATGAFYKSGNWDDDLDHIEEVYFDGGDFLVGELDEQIVAMIALKKISEDIGEIKRMRVHPDYQRRGFGQIILEELEKRAKELGFKELTLDTTIKQIAAQKFYEKNDYVEVRRETKGYPLETIFYKKDLS